MIIRALLRFLSLVVALLPLHDAYSSTRSYNVREYGAKGDGVTLDSPAINRAIDAAAAAGGGKVVLPPGRYFSGSIRLKSNIELRIEKGATIVADKWNSRNFDPTERYEHGPWQDGGHSFFQNSLIWGENLENVTISGEGLIDGSALTSWQGELNKKIGFGQGSQGDNPAEPVNLHEPTYAANKTIALKLCRNVTIRDISILRGGWFAIILTGCDDVLLEGLTIDTNRDGINIDASVNVTVRNCRVNSPADDAICPKSTYALGYPRITENILIENCQVSGFKVGTLLDGTRQPDPKNHKNGRIKFGTESSGGFRNVIVRDCTFISCMGFTLQMVDGGILENVRVSNLRMTDVKNYALYIVTGERNRTPNLTTVSRMKNVVIENIVAEGVDVMSGIQIFGMPHQPIEGLRLENISIVSRGGGTEADASRRPRDLGRGYPDPSGRGNMPAYGIFARHVRGLELIGLDFTLESPDARPVAQFENIQGLRIDRFTAELSPGVTAARFAGDVSGLSITNSPLLKP